MAKKKKKAVTQEPASSPLKREILLLAIIIFSILSLLSLFDLCGAGGKLLAGLLFGLFGAVSYLFPVVLPIAAGFLISNPENKALRRKIYYSGGLYICLCSMFEWVVDSGADNMIEVFRICSKERIGGGLFGGLLANLLTLAIGRAGSFIVIIGFIILFAMLITRKLIFAAIRDLYEETSAKRAAYEEDEEEADESSAAVRARKPIAPERHMNVHTFEKKKKKKEKKEKEKEKEIGKEPDSEAGKGSPDISIIRAGNPPADEKLPSEPSVYKEELETKFGTKELVKQPEEQIPDKPIAAKRKKTDADEMETGIQQIAEEAAQPDTAAQSYTFPSLELLSKPKGGTSVGDDELIQTASKLQQTLESFGVKVKMGDVSCGPSVTRYELVPEQGVKVSSITRLTDDIKLSLAASDIRIEAPIPGKAAVGIEVPNAKRNMVTLRELLESREFAKAKSNVSFAVGKDISGQTVVTDIAKMPHLLVAGATGSGKSVCINTLIMSILYKASPDDVKFIMVDPKMVELTAYADIPHLMIPVVTDPKKASAALNWAVQEMTVRYNQFAELGVRDMGSYNKKIAGLTHNEDGTYAKMCQIVIIVDEFADLMMVAPGEVEDAVCRLAQLARAAGIHLVLATQRPSVNVITGLIKANIPSRIALSVSSAIDSRTIIDGAGAEKLLGNGDMLFAPQDYPKPVRIQGAFVSDEERDGVVAFLKEQQSGPSYDEEITKHIEENPVGTKSGAAGAASGGAEQDELFVEAARFIIEKDKASIGMLQRAFRIGFNRAARIMDQLSEAGVVGPEEGTKPRMILMSMEQFEQYLEGGDE